MKSIGIIVGDITVGHGTERAVVNLANLLSDKYSIYIISSYSTEGNAYFMLNENVQILHLGIRLKHHTNVFTRFFSYYFQYNILRKKIFELHSTRKFFCLIGTHFTFNFVLAKLKYAKTVGCEHFAWGATNRLSHVLKKVFYPKLDKCVVLTKADSLHYSFIKHNNLVVIPNSLSFAPPEALPNYDSKKMVAVGRLCYQKGFDMLISACEILNQSYTDWTLEIVGEGNDFESLKQKIGNANLMDKISILPPRHDIGNVYQTACCFIMSSRFEGLPMVLIEAQSCGLPCISFDCPEGPAEVIQDGVTGLLIERNNISALADAMKKVVSSPELCKEMGINSRINALRFSPSVIRKQWINLIEQI